MQKIVFLQSLHLSPPNEIRLDSSKKVQTCKKQYYFKHFFIYERLPQWLWLERSSQHMQIVITGAMLQLGQSPGITAGAVAPVITCYAPAIT